MERLVGLYEADQYPAARVLINNIPPMARQLVQLEKMLDQTLADAKEAKQYSDAIYTDIVDSTQCYN
jgi:hypothetical protein